MDAKIDRLIELSIRITKFVSHQTDQTFEERVATILQFHTLCFLEITPESKLSNVARHLNASLSSTTQLVERMHKLGLVQRTSDADDRRITHLSATVEGIKKLHQMKETKRNRMKKLLAHIETHDLNELIRIQEKLLKGLQEKIQE